jgi:hypothetical protein
MRATRGSIQRKGENTMSEKIPVIHPFVTVMFCSKGRGKSLNLDRIAVVIDDPRSIEVQESLLELALDAVKRELASLRAMRAKRPKAKTERR